MNSDFRSRLEGERPYLLRYASLQLRDSHAAEDVVQETLLAALAGEAGFGGRSNLRTWDDPDGSLEQKQFLRALEECDGCSSFSKQVALLRRAMKRLAD